jgi:hypothetical protein
MARLYVVSLADVERLIVQRTIKRRRLQAAFGQNSVERGRHRWA